MSIEDSTPRGAIRQGDVLLVPLSDDPDTRRGRVVSRATVVLAHGEATGHAHRITDRRAHLRIVKWTGQRLLVVHGDEPVTLQHDEHDPLAVPPGVWEVRRQREYAPRRNRRVMD